MKVLRPDLRARAGLGAHPRAPALLTGLSFAEAVVFPVPPEVMLAPMCVVAAAARFWFATLSLVGSLAGAVVGYLLGHYAYELVKPLFASLGWIDRIDAQVAYLREVAAQSPWKTFWILVLAGFTPIPLKFFTWASGIVGVPMLPFMASMAVGRGKRVYLIALAIRLGGARAEARAAPLHRAGRLGRDALLVAGVGWLAGRGRAHDGMMPRHADRPASRCWLRALALLAACGSSRVRARRRQRGAAAARVGAEVRRHRDRATRRHAVPHRDPQRHRPLDLAMWNDIAAAVHDLSGPAPAPVSRRRAPRIDAPRRRAVRRAPRATGVATATAGVRTARRAAPPHAGRQQRSPGAGRPTAS